MAHATFTNAELDAFLAEALPAEVMARIEEALRCDRELVERLTSIHTRRDTGTHSLGAVWRDGQLTCPTRAQLGSYLLGVLPENVSRYITFHIETVACRYCAANLADLELQGAESTCDRNGRRERLFRSSAGYLKASAE
jgi:hypothetical protein